MKVLITGANGQVGFCLTKKLQQEGLEFLSLTREELDIGDSVKVFDVVKKYSPDIIVNAAAYTAVDKAESEVDLAYRVNRDGPGNLAEAASIINAAIFHISTDYVFNGQAQGLYKEDDETAPQGVYGESKLEGERAVVMASPRHIILRTAWVFGEHGNNFVKTMIRLGRDRDQLGIVADQFGGPTYAGDIAEALVELVRRYKKEKQLPWGIYHFSGFPHVSWYEFAEHIFAEVSRQGIYAKQTPLLKAITTNDYPTPARRPANSKLNCIKIQKNFNVEMSDWKTALKNIKSYS